MITGNDIVKIKSWFQLPHKNKWANDVYANKRNKYWHIWFTEKGMIRYHDKGKIKEIQFETLDEFIKWSSGMMDEIEISLLKSYSL